MSDALGGTGDVRVSDADRDLVIAQLRQHAAEGRLTLDEFSERVGQALRAVTRADLDAVLADLPTGSAPVPAKGRVRRWFVAVMSGAEARGRWRTGDRVNAVALMGGCHLDFRRAVIDGPEVVVTAIALMGGIHIVVPEGVEVELTGLPIMGGRHLQIADVPVLPGSPRIVVRAFPIMGGVEVRSKAAGEKDETPAVPGMPPMPGVPTVPGMPVPGVPTVPGMPVPGVHGVHGVPAGQVPFPPNGAEPFRGVPHQPEASVTVPEGTVTIMFSDVCGFSELTERLGDVAMHRLLAEHNRIVRAEVAAHDGQVVKANGDGFMVVFTSAARALRCAAAVQQAVRRVHPGGEEVRLHIGLHAGEVVHDGTDLIGQAVNLASRLTDAAGPDEILVSTLARELAAGSREFRFGEPREVELKGLGPRVAFPLEWKTTETV